jgi:hypothetical protein
LWLSIIICVDILSASLATFTGIDTDGDLKTWQRWKDGHPDRLKAYDKSMRLSGI